MGRAASQLLYFSYLSPSYDYPLSFLGHFFLRDYAKRVDVAGGNLLLFIAFNFVISQDLPRLGYLTFLDLILISTFLVTAIVLVLAVALKRMVSDGKEALVRRIDKYVIIFYPLAYIGTVLAVFLIFK